MSDELLKFNLLLPHSGQLFGTRKMTRREKKVMQELMDRVKASLPHGTHDAIADWITTADWPSDLKIYALNAAFLGLDLVARTDVALACCDKLALVEIDDAEFALQLEEWVASVRFQLLMLMHRSEQARSEAFSDLAECASDVGRRPMLSSALRRAQEVLSHKTSESKASGEAWMIHAELAKARGVTSTPVALANRVCMLLVAVGATEPALDGYTLTLKRLGDSEEREAKWRALFARAELLSTFERFDESLHACTDLLGQMTGFSDQHSATLKDAILDLQSLTSAALSRIAARPAAPTGF